MPSSEHRDALSRPDWGPWIVTAVLLAGSVAYGRAAAPTAREVRAFEGRVLFPLPAGWSGHEETSGEHRAFVAQRPTVQGLAPTVLVEPVEPPDEGGADALFRDLEVARMQEVRASRGVGYRVLHIDERAPEGGPRSTWVWYAIVRDPPNVPAGAAVLPIVVVGADVLVITEAGNAWHVAAFQPAHSGADDEAALRRIVEGLRFL